MKKIIVFLLCMFCITPSFATMMCKHKSTYIASVSKSTNGTSHSVTNATNKTWSATFPNYTITGNAACNDISGTTGTANTALYTVAADEGVHCWCEMQQPISSYWVYLKSYSDKSACASGCASDCGAAIQSNATYRTNVLDAVW